MYYACARIKAVIFILSFSILLVSCSTSDEKAIYENVSVEKPLIVPPDLELPKQNEAFTVPEIAPQSTTYNIYSKNKSKGTSGGLLKERITGIKLLRDGAIRWLEIDAQPEEIWAKAIDFYKKTGFKIKIKEPEIGLIETDWLENKATGQLDKYRVRLERNNANTKTLLFLTHQGAKEKESSSTEKELTWIPVGSDPELEAEMLQRFLVYLGNDKKDALKIFSIDGQAKRTKLVKEKDKIFLIVKEIFPRTWRRTGLAIDRLGFVVEDKNRSAGIYYIKVSEKYIETEMDNDRAFSKLFSDDQQKMTQFIISLEDKKDKTQVRILTRQGDENKSPLQKHILEKLEELLK